MDRKGRHDCADGLDARSVISDWVSLLLPFMRQGELCSASGFEDQNELIITGARSLICIVKISSVHI